MAKSIEKIPNEDPPHMLCGTIISWFIKIFGLPENIYLAREILEISRCMSYFDLVVPL